MDNLGLFLIYIVAFSILILNSNVYVKKVNSYYNILFTLRINNLKKIKQEDIDIDGITVVAGENNTGKSTIGKVLFSTFNSLILLIKFTIKD